MELVILWIVFAVVIAIVAEARGRSGFGWLVVSLLLSPIISVIILALLPNLKLAQQGPPPEPPGSYVRCPECQEQVLRAARKCKHCGSALTPT